MARVKGLIVRQDNQGTPAKITHDQPSYKMVILHGDKPPHVLRETDNTDVVCQTLPMRVEKHYQGGSIVHSIVLHDWHTHVKVVRLGDKVPPFVLELGNSKPSNKHSFTACALPPIHHNQTTTCIRAMVATANQLGCSCIRAVVATANQLGCSCLLLHSLPLPLPVASHPPTATGFKPIE
jgi:hypothetical protein